MITVDRIEEGTAIVYSDGAKSEIPLSELPAGVREGNVLKQQNGVWEIDKSAEEKRRKEIAEKLHKAFK